MTTAISISQTHDLGQWPALLKGAKRTSMELPYTPANFSVQEQTDLKIYPIDPSTGKPNLNHTLECSQDPASVYEGLFKTQSTWHKRTPLLVVFIPLRTHTFKDLCLDTLCPFTRRSLEEQTSVLERINFVVIDLFTLVFRLITFIPRTIYNYCKEQHPLKGAFGNDVESVYVECQKNWKLQGEVHPETPIHLENEQSFTYFWRVDFESPLQTGIEFDGKEVTLDSNGSDNERCVYHSFEHFSDLSKFCNSLDYGSGAAARISFLDKNAEDLFLYQKLQKLTEFPTVTFI